MTTEKIPDSNLLTIFLLVSIFFYTYVDRKKWNTFFFWCSYEQISFRYVEKRGFRLYIIFAIISLLRGLLCLKEILAKCILTINPVQETNRILNNTLQQKKIKKWVIKSEFINEWKNRRQTDWNIFCYFDFL